MKHDLHLSDLAIALSLFALAVGLPSSNFCAFAQASQPTTQPVTMNDPVPASAAPDQARTAARTAAMTAAMTASKAASATPADPKAKQTFEESMLLLKKRNYAFALDGFRKADKQDGGHCVPCELQAYQAARQAPDYKAAREAAAALLESVSSLPDKARAHYMAGAICLVEGMANHHDKSFQAADNEFTAALKLQPDKADCLYGDGLALAHLKQDGEARERFQQFLKVSSSKDVDYDRAQRFVEHPEIARARVAPNFQFKDLAGKSVTLESLSGKVVLIDFWATWCGPCREALPRVQALAKKFDGQPLVVLSISMDSDDAGWREFVSSHQMTWMQYRDGRFGGPVAKLFNVNAIPATFTIDVDGVLQDQHVGDADIEGKIRKLVARANEAAQKKTVAALD